MIGLVIVCRMTSKSKGYVFEVPVEGPRGQSFVLCDQIRTFDIKERVREQSGHLSQNEISNILARLQVLFQ